MKLFMAALLFSSFAQAADHYTDLMKDYSQGTLPTMTQVQGWWSGRCYSKTAPDDTIGMLLVAEPITQQTTKPDDGPLFPPQTPTTDFKAALVNIGGTSEQADRFDTLSSDDESTIQTFLSSENMLQMQTKSNAGELMSTNTEGGVTYMVRKYQSYFVVDMEPISQATADASYACYFFKKVHD